MNAAAVIGTFGHAVLRLVTTVIFASRLAPDLITDFAVRRPRIMARPDIETNDDTVELPVSQNHDFGLSTSNPAPT